MNRCFIYGLILLLSGLWGCTGMRYVKSTDPLYTGSEINILDEHAPHKIIKGIAGEVIKPKPNTKTLWMRPALARYNMLSDSAKVKKFWKNKIDPPVLLSHAHPNLVAAAIQNHLFHNGYFKNCDIMELMIGFLIIEFRTINRIMDRRA